VPGHLALGLAAGAWAWLVCMAPGLLRPHGPERRATAQALKAAAAYADTRGTGTGHARARTAATAAVLAARQALLTGGARSASARPALAHLLLRAEIALAAPADADPERLRAWARALRGTGPVPHDHDGVPTAPEPDAQEGPAERLWHRLVPLAPLAARTALGCALAGYASLALGIGRPYWALVTAAALYQANLALTWNRSVQRVVGNLAGVLVFAAVAPLAHLGQAALVLCCLAFSFGAEALISRNYWLGSVCVTPMALLITEFTGYRDPGDLVTERIVDTLVGALLGLAAAVAVTNRRAGARLGHALTAAERARERAARLLAEPHPAPGALEAARRALAAALVELRATADAASGEWWQRTPPEDGVDRAEQAGHRTLAETVRRQGLILEGRAPGPAADPTPADHTAPHHTTADRAPADDDTTEDLRP
jgi:uncharacterized membrane protein YccC